MSNIVYVVFALALLFLAIANIFSKEGGNWTLKSKLPRFLFGILMVPFTWFIVSLTLSVANVATAAVLTLPKDTITELVNSGEDSEIEWLQKELIPKNVNLSFGDKKDE